MMVRIRIGIFYDVESTPLYLVYDDFLSGLNPGPERQSQTVFLVISCIIYPHHSPRRRASVWSTRLVFHQSIRPSLFIHVV